MNRGGAAGGGGGAGAGAGGGGGAGSGPTSAAALAAAKKQKKWLESVETDIANIVDHFSHLVNVSRVCFSLKLNVIICVSFLLLIKVEVSD